MLYFGMEFSDNTFLQAYRDYSIIDRMTCILTAALNYDFDHFNFGTHTHVVLVTHSEGHLEYHWFDGSLNRHSVIVSDQITGDEERLGRVITLRFETLKAEKVINEQWSQIGNTQYFLNHDNKDIYIVAVADWKGYPISTLWKHVIDVFVRNWQWIWDDTKQFELLNLPSPVEAIRNADLHWGIHAVPCCRMMAESGFDTGYGDPYESEVLFDVVSKMASSFYERRTSEGVIVPISADKEPEVAFVQPVVVDLANARIFRKYLEMSRGGLALAIKGYELVGLTESSHSDSKIVISGTNTWSFNKDGVVQFVVSDNIVNVSTSVSNDEALLNDKQKEEFQNADVIEIIAKEARRQPHGTTVVFTDEAESESCRLSQFHRCELIKPIDLCQNNEYILSLTSIDGALIVGTNGKCYGVGAILDGEAMNPGNIGRGARYNSAINYVAWRKHKSPYGKYCAVIISEDSIVDIITTQTVDNISDDSIDYI